MYRKRACDYIYACICTYVYIESLEQAQISSVIVWTLSLYM